MKKTPGGGHIGSLAEQSIPDWLQPYIKAYPKVKAFIVTGDRMVFLPRQSAEAAEHQKALNSKNKMNAPGGSPAIQIYKRPAAAGKNK